MADLYFKGDVLTGVAAAQRLAELLGAKRYTDTETVDAACYLAGTANSLRPHDTPPTVGALPQNLDDCAEALRSAVPDKSGGDEPQTVEGFSLDWSLVWSVARQALLLLLKGA